MEVEVTRAAAIASISATFHRTRVVLRVLVGLMGALLLLVHVIVTAAYISGSASSSDFYGLNGILAPITLGSAAVLAWTFRQGEAALIEALEGEPPRIRRASYLEFRGRYGVRPGVELQTHDSKLWRVEMPEPLVHDVVKWLQNEAARANAAGLT